MAQVNPRVDVVFKKLFSVEENKDLLISLINSIVSEEDQVEDVTVLNPYNSQSFREEKLSVLDIKAKGLNGKIFNIEMQINDEADYDKRALYYWAKLYSEQLRSGDDYTYLQKAIGIHILNFTSIPNNKKYHNIFHITEKETGIKYFNDLELHTIELKKFSGSSDREFADLIPKIQTSLDMWVAFLTRHDLMRGHTTSPIIKKAIEVVDVMDFSPEERDIYEGHLKWLRLEASAVKKAKEDGLKEGRAEGKVEGIGEGLLKGQCIIAKRLLKQGYSLEMISEVTMLSIDVIRKNVQDESL